ncbi:CapA family protein [Kordiimonas lacus]|uniref:Poly-gamma-glutamate synthesis protein (Capsule biosynthesis protein) n=1 Tax=Kordiimonas lacus TaxID=637679 RepID=A0A1G6TD21_9PROT|nr:CapA family protein [Kordiimonas lacus]SDD26436.1 poly-gamma-glutamate synthesis protein (capsule biosynthesis protein) [Kordiimonas lacus]
MTNHSRVRLVAVGDIMLGRGVRKSGFSDAKQLLAPEILNQLKGDIVTGNLECLIGGAGSPNPSSHSHFQGDPDFAGSLLEMFDVVSLANNHVGDFGDQAVAETLAWLDQIGVQHVGVGSTLEEAVEPALFDIQGMKIAIFGATTVGNLQLNSRYTLAVPGRFLYQRAARLLDAGYRCILHLHAGGGDVSFPAPAIRSLMTQARKAGFSIVLGHHPHVVQGIDRTDDGVVFFSMGDFVFDKLNDGRDQALVAIFALANDARADTFEIEVVQRGADLSLSLLAGESKDTVFRKLRDLSDMITNGQSDARYLVWRGSKWRRLFQSSRRDFRAGGFPALWAKLGRVSTRKLYDLLLRR